MMFPELCFAAKFCKFLFPVAWRTFVPRWNSEKGKFQAGMTRFRVGNELLGEPIMLNTINELKCQSLASKPRLELHHPQPLEAGKFWELLLSRPLPITLKHT